MVLSTDWMGSVEAECHLRLVGEGSRGRSDNEHDEAENGVDY